MSKITMEFARQDDCLDKMVPSDLRQLIGDKERAEEQCKALAAQVYAANSLIFDTQAENTLLREKLSVLTEHRAVLEEAMENIVEYWNKDRNDEAMHDACWHNVNTAAGALKEVRSERIRQEVE